MYNGNINNDLFNGGIRVKNLQGWRDVTPIEKKIVVPALKGYLLLGTALIIFIILPMLLFALYVLATPGVIDIKPDEGEVGRAIAVATFGMFLVLIIYGLIKNIILLIKWSVTPIQALECRVVSMRRNKGSIWVRVRTQWEEGFESMQAGRIKVTSDTWWQLSDILRENDGILLIKYGGGIVPIKFLPHDGGLGLNKIIW